MWVIKDHASTVGQAETGLPFAGSISHWWKNEETWKQIVFAKGECLHFLEPWQNKGVNPRFEPN